MQHLHKTLFISILTEMSMSVTLFKRENKFHAKHKLCYMQVAMNKNSLYTYNFLLLVHDLARIATTGPQWANNVVLVLFRGLIMLSPKKFI